MTVTIEPSSDVQFEALVEGFHRVTADVEPAPEKPWIGAADGGGITPRPLQVTALAALTRAFAVHDRTQLVMACGTGKTLVGRWHAQAADAQQVVVFVPSLPLLAQTLGEWRRVSGWAFEALVVCSDPSTAAGAAERRGDDGVLQEVEQPYWATVKANVTTSPSAAARFLRRKVHDRPQVVFSTYHSAPVVVEAQAVCGAVFDLAVCDEAHRLAGRPRPEFRTVLDQRAIRARKRLFMTATPTIVEGDDTASMDDTKLFGPVAHRVTFAAAIAAGQLTDYQVLVVAARDGTEPNRRTVLASALFDAVDRFGVRRILSFHSRVSRAAAFAELVDAVNTPGGRFIRARHINGTQPTAERAETLRWLGADGFGQVRLVTNARCLTEGVDVPAIDGVLFGDRRESVVDIIQAVSRALRPAPGKTIATIVVPVGLPDDSDDDTNLTVSSFGHVWAVLRALRAHDERLAVDVDLAARTIVGTRMCRSRASDQVEFVLPEGLDEQMLQLRLVQEVGSPWEKFFRAAEDWALANPGRRLGRNMSHHGVGIGEWAFNQRTAHARGLLSAEYADRLERIPGWYWNRDDADWADSFEVLRAFAVRHGTVAENATGPSVFEGLRSRGATPRRLGVWVAMQRQAYRDGTLSAARAAQLEQLPGWTWHAELAEQHIAMVQALIVFCEFEKHADVPEDHQEDGLPLGRWMWAIRRAKLLGTLPPALADEISAATPRGPKGVEVFKWEHIETQWRLGYSALRQFATREGHAAPPTSHTEVFAGHSVQLGQWASLQRHRQRHGKLDTRHLAWLEAVPGWRWEVPGVAKEYGEPLDLGEHPHGTAKGIQAKCPCQECRDARRAADRQRLAERRQLNDPVPAGWAAHHLKRLEMAGAKRTTIATLAGVPLGVVRKVVSGEWKQVERAHEQAILAVTVEACAAANNRAGSRGRMICADNERIDAAPTLAILDDLDRRGFGRLWVSRELGYVGGLQIGRQIISRRIADQIATLAAQVGDLSYPRRGNERVPPLRDLLAARAGA